MICAADFRAEFRYEMSTAASSPSNHALVRPAGATDCHVHVFNPARFAFAADAPYRPVASECGTALDLEATLDATGIDRVVLVNPTSGYGDDNRCMLDALARLGPRARGIARMPLDVPGDSLDGLKRNGVVGVRVDCLASGAFPFDERRFVGLLGRLADRDMTCAIQAEAAQWTTIAPLLARVPVSVVADHMGRPDPAEGVNAPGFRALLSLAGLGRVAVKVSGPMRFSKRPPPYEDVDPFVTALAHAFTTSALVWGSDWPFLRTDRRFDYAPMLALLARWFPDAGDREAILAETPERWFFPR